MTLAQQVDHLRTLARLDPDTTILELKIYRLARLEKKISKIRAARLFSG